MGQYGEAKQIGRTAVAASKKVLGPEYPDTLTSRSNLAMVLDRQGKYKEAEAMNWQTLAQQGSGA
jgi:hypothetical protein